MTLVYYTIVCCLLWAITTAPSISAKEVPVLSKSNGECVVMLHGMGRTAQSMKKLEKSLMSSGYMVWNKSYPSRSQSIESLAAGAIEPALSHCARTHARKVHFVTHSLGGILVRYYLQNHSLENLGRIVMLSPPNHGSEVADLLKNFFLYQWITGPAGQQLITNEEGLPRSLRPIAGEIAVIVGNKSSDPWFSPFIPGPDDGKVSVQSAQLSEMTDFMVVPCGHTFIMNSAFVAKETLHFLSHGSFQRSVVPAT